MSGSLHELRTLVALEIAHADRTRASVCAAVEISEKHLSQFLVGHCGMSFELVDRVLAELGRELVLSTRVRKRDGSSE